ncbi:MAG: hypothetical protein SynsKO_33610 [Synoicihabitans sp.]
MNMTVVQDDKPRVNQADVARALGLSQSTVSIALKGDTRVSKKTTDLINKKAAEMGYVPDPNLAALSMYRRRSRMDKVASGMAWITNHPTKDGWRSAMCEAYRKGASERAAILGYKLYDFWMGDPEISSARLRQILITQGIRGLLFCPQAEYHTKIDFDFSEFAAVTFGYSLQHPSLHMVSNYQHQTVRLAYRSLQNRGYERIGILLKDDVDRRVDRNFSGGYHSLNPSGMDEDFLPPFLFENFLEKDFKKWFDRWTPDAVLVTGDSSKILRQYVENMGLEIGIDLAFAELNIGPDSSDVAGVDQQSEVIGRAGANVLDSLLSHFEYGIPSNPLNTLVDGVWRDGSSAPRKIGA